MVSRRGRKRRGGGERGREGGRRAGEERKEKQRYSFLSQDLERHADTAVKHTSQGLGERVGILRRKVYYLIKGLIVSLLSLA